MSDQKKRRILFRFKMFCSVIENFVSKEKQRGKNRMIWSDKKKHSNECFFCVLSVAKNEFFLFLIHIETTSFFFIDYIAFKVLVLLSLYDLWKFSTTIK